MNLYYAPLEGITTLIYRNVHREMFGGVDFYYAPFISPSEQDKVNKKGIRDILPELNGDLPLRAQVLTRDSVAFSKFADKVKAIGYDEINLNFGCPAGTVVKKGRGSGFLKEPESIESFLSYVFEENKIKVSVKTRIGFSSAEEWQRLMEVYNKFPIELLTVHPRNREMLYGGVPDMRAFEYAYNVSENPLCYNGNIFSVRDFELISGKFPKVEGFMLGRGAVKNPALFREIKGGKPLATEELISFSNRLTEEYCKGIRSEVYTLHKLKEIWVYMLQNFPEEKKIAKAMKKASSLEDFKKAAESLPEIKGDRNESYCGL